MNRVVRNVIRELNEEKKIIEDALFKLTGKSTKPATTHPLKAVTAKKSSVKRPKTK